MATLFSQQFTKLLSSNHKNCSLHRFLWLFSCNENTHCTICFLHCEKNSLLLLVSLLKFYFIAKSGFFSPSIYWGKRKKFSPFSLLEVSCPKPLHREQAQLAPTPLNSRPQEAAWEKKQRTDMENKVRKKKENWEEKNRFRKDLPQCTASQGHQPSKEQVQEGTSVLLGALLGTGWAREGQKLKMFPAAPPVHHLPSIPANCSLNKQLWGKTGDKGRQKVMCWIYKNVFLKRICHVFYLSVPAQRNYVHT